MKITITFDSLEEMYAHMRLNEGFQPIPVTLAAAEQPAQEPQEAAAHISGMCPITAREPQGAPEGFQPEENPPFDEKPAEAVTEDFRVEVRKILAKLNKATTKSTAGDLIESMGVSSRKLSDVPLEDLPALMKKAKEAYDAC